MRAAQQPSWCRFLGPGLTTTQLFYIAEFAYVIESALTKTSIVVLYLRIFPSKRFRNLCFGMLAFIVCFAVVFLVTLLTYCVPFDCE